MENLKGIKKGDKIWSPNYGYGTVISIDESEYPINVDFDNGNVNSYT